MSPKTQAGDHQTKLCLFWIKQKKSGYSKPKTGCECKSVLYWHQEHSV